MDEEFLTTADVAQLLRVDGSTIRRWRLDGVGPRFVQVGSVYRYPASLLAAWLDERVRNGRAA